MANSFSRARVNLNAAVENTTIKTLYTPRWNEPKVDFNWEYKVNGRTVRDYRWAVTKSVRIGSRVVGVPSAVILSPTLWATHVTLGTALGTAGAATAVGRDAAGGKLKLPKSAKRGFVKGHIVSATVVGLAGMVVMVPATIAAAIGGLAGAVVLTLPAMAVGAFLDR